MTPYPSKLLLAASLIALALPLSGPARAQVNPDLPPANAAGPAGDLGRALSRLNSDPRNIEALIAAGEAAQALNDPRAAAGFLMRAEAVDPNSGRVKAGLGRAFVALENPTEALRLFDEAERLGAPQQSYVADRAYARDLNGDNAGALADYQAALRLKPNDPTLTRRYAIALGIGGRWQEADKLLDGLLRSGDREAWRNRAFVLAMNGQQDQARRITQSTMPAQLASAIQPYLDRMPLLTAEQKAKAAHLGQFPNGMLARAAPPPAPPAAVATVAAAAPKKLSRREREAQRRAELQRQADARAAADAAAAAARARSAATLASNAARPPAATVKPAPAPTRVEPVRSAPAVSATPSPTLSPTPSGPVLESRVVGGAQIGSTSTAVRRRVLVPIPGTAAATTTETRTETTVDADLTPNGANVTASADTPTTTQPAAAPIQRFEAAGPPDGARAPAPQTQPSFASAQPVASTAGSNAAPQPAALDPAEPPPVDRTLANIFASIDASEEQQQVSVAPRVDLEDVAALQKERRRAEAAAAAKAKADAEAKAKAKKEAEEKARLKANPSRIWVQIATGRSTSALAFDMRKFRKQAPDALAKKDAWTAAWGQTNRLVVGPFASSAKAKAFLDAWKKADGDGFLWTSDAGEAVTPLGGGG